MSPYLGIYKVEWTSLTSWQGFFFMKISLFQTENRLGDKGYYQTKHPQQLIIEEFNSAMLEFLTNGVWLMRVHRTTKFLSLWTGYFKYLEVLMPLVLVVMRRLQKPRRKGKWAILSPMTWPYIKHTWHNYLYFKDSRCFYLASLITRNLYFDTYFVCRFGDAPDLSAFSISSINVTHINQHQFASHRQAYSRLSLSSENIERTNFVSYVIDVSNRKSSRDTEFSEFLCASDHAITSRKVSLVTGQPRDET